MRRISSVEGRADTVRVCTGCCSSENETRRPFAVAIQRMPEASFHWMDMSSPTGDSPRMPIGSSRAFDALRRSVSLGRPVFTRNTMTRDGTSGTSARRRMRPLEPGRSCGAGTVGMSPNPRNCSTGRLVNVSLSGWVTGVVFMDAHPAPTVQRRRIAGMIARIDF